MSKLFKKSFGECYADETTPGEGEILPTGGSELSKEDMIDFMSEDDEDREVLDLKTSKPKEEEKEDEGEEGEGEGEEESDELAEIEEELNPPTDEQLELVTPVRRREILAKYPTLFKDFPYLEKAYYREGQFTEIFPTIPEAKEAAEKARTLDNFEADLVNNGNTETILKTVHDQNPESFKKIVDNYLPTLAKVDEKAYLHCVGNITKHTIMAMVREAKASGSDALRSAAQILNQFAFGTSNFVPPQNLSSAKPEGEQKPEGESREQTFIKQQLETTVNDLNTRVNNTLKNTIEANIDPRKSMTDFVRKHATSEALQELNGLLEKDTRFKAIADKLWEAAVKANFSKESVDRIKSAYLSRSKTLLPAVIKKARNEALKGMGKRVDSDRADRSPVRPGQPRSQQPSGKVKNAKDIPKGMSTLDFLNAD